MTGSITYRIGAWYADRQLPLFQFNIRGFMRDKTTKNENDKIQQRKQAFSAMSEKLQPLARQIDETLNRAGEKGHVYSAPMMLGN